MGVRRGIKLTCVNSWIKTSVCSNPPFIPSDIQSSFLFSNVQYKGHNAIWHVGRIVYAMACFGYSLQRLKLPVFARDQISAHGSMMMKGEMIYLLDTEQLSWYLLDNETLTRRQRWVRRQRWLVVLIPPSEILWEPVGSRLRLMSWCGSSDSNWIINDVSTRSLDSGEEV